jgi:HEPN domain-containing protein
MTQEETIKFWLNSCLDDFGTAKAMFTAYRYNYTMFMCQQSLEELLKAIIVMQTQDQPPFIHDLILLSKKIAFKIPKQIQENLRDINPHYIIARYKPQRFDPKIYSRHSAKETIKATQGVIKWFTKKMELRKYLGNL